jgi:hypothetical protein
MNFPFQTEMKKLIFTLFCLCVLFPTADFAQKNDSVAPVNLPLLRNVIKFNPTPMILWDWRNVTFSYERILSPRQTISVELGYLVFPKLIEDTLANLLTINSHQKWGLNATVEYRFYLTKLNSRPIPAGLYIGPYLTYYRYAFNNGFDIVPAKVDSTGMISGDFWSFNLGLELGYQFVFWKRWTLDLVMIGPSVSYYGGKTAITGSLDAGQIQEANEALYDKLMEKYPAFQYMSLNKSYQQTGKLDVFRMGFRYLVQIGFRF